MEVTGQIPEIVEPKVLENKEIRNKKRRLMGVDEFLREGAEEGNSWKYQSEIYENYANAIRRRDREPLSEESFKRHFFEGGSFDDVVVFGDKDNGCILGCRLNGVFVPTHFAPTGILGGGRLIKDLLNSDIPTALFITEDLRETIVKMKGWKVLPIKIESSFRGQKVIKEMVVNRWDAVSRLIGYQVDRTFKDVRHKVELKIKDSPIVRSFSKKVEEKSEDFEFCADLDELWPSA